MHYYKRDIGKYAKKTMRLSMLEHGSYTLLLDSCYDRERFPTEQEAIEWTWAKNDDEIAAVKFVLSRFFELQDDGTYVQSEVKQTLEKYWSRCGTNKVVAVDRERKKKEYPKIVNESCTNRDDSERNYKLLITNQELQDKKPKAKPAKAVLPDWIPKDAWLGFVEMRKAKKKPLTERAIHSIEKKLIEFMNRGYDIAQILDQSTINGWTDVYAPKDNTGAYYANNQRLTPTQQRAAESQRIDDLLRSGAAGILGHSNQDFRPTQDCAPVAVSARLPNGGISDGSGEVVGEYVSSRED